MTAGLWVQEGTSRGMWLVLPAAEVVLGRDLDADFALADPEASRRHVALVPEAGGFRLRDLGSRNGTRVNGVPETDRLLADGDRIRIGATLFEYRTSIPALEPDETVAVTPRASTVVATPSAEPAPGPAIPDPGPRAASAPPFAEPLLVGESQAMQTVYAWIRKAAPVDAPVLLTGETGTGKELVARALHAGGARRRGPFVALNCAAVPAELFESELFGHARGAFTGAFTARKGLVELARGGTLFLDEIGECPPAAQAKLLRVLDAREVLPVGADRPVRVDFRLVSATHADLPALAEEGRFRPDLLFRLRVLEIPLPPLRERGDDVTLLAERFLHELRPHHPAVREFAPAALELLRRCRWPGNVRELRNAVERAAILAAGPRIEPADLPVELRAEGREPGADDSTLLRDVERRHVLRVLRLADGNKSRAAAMLGIDRGTLYHRLKEWGVS